MAADLELRREGRVFILDMRSGENRFNQDFVDAFNRGLDTVEASSGPAALVTIGTEKFYSNGLDLDWMASAGSGGDFLASVLRLLGRVLGFPVPTVAAINGHAFAAGAMLALAHDFRAMRADRGFFCLPEVDINLPLAPGMTALIACRLGPAVLRDLVLTGVRLGGTEAKRAGRRRRGPVARRTPALGRRARGAARRQAATDLRRAQARHVPRGARAPRQRGSPVRQAEARPEENR